jgi:hypothetical protein
VLGGGDAGDGMQATRRSAQTPANEVRGLPNLQLTLEGRGQVKGAEQ